MSRDINLNLIDPDKRNARKHFDEASINELAQSIKATGLAVPIMVRPAGDRFTIVHGERRYRAITSLGWATIPADVRDIDDEAASWLALVENLQRADLSPIEEAQAYQVKLASGITQSELGRKLGKTQSYIAQKLRLLTLPDPIRFYLDRRVLSEGHARELLRLRSIYNTDARVSFAEDIESWSTGQIFQQCCAVDAVALCMNALRPFAYPFGGIKPKDTAMASLQEGALSAFAQYVMVNNGSIEAWSMAATHTAMVAVALGLSVAKVSKWIDAWRRRFYSNVIFVSIRSDQNRGKEDEEIYLAALDDLEHAGIVDSDIPMDLYIAAGDLVLRGDDPYYILPSAYQSYGPAKDVGRKLHSKHMSRDII